MTNKEIILQTALLLFAEQGYDRTPTSQIAKEAGVSEGLIFRHYGNKAGLLQAIIGEGLAQIAGTMQSYQDASIEPRTAILEHIRRSCRLMQEHETFWRLAQKVRFQPAVLEAASVQMEEVNRFIIGQLTRNFQKLGYPSPETEALLLFALIDGVTIHYLQNPKEYPLEAMQDILLEKYR